MLTDDTTCFFDTTMEECLLWGHPDPASVRPETVRSALELAGLHKAYFEDFEEARKHRSKPGQTKPACSCFTQRFTDGGSGGGDEAAAAAVANATTTTTDGPPTQSPSSLPLELSAAAPAPAPAQAMIVATPVTAAVESNRQQQQQQQAQKPTIPHPHHASSFRDPHLRHARHTRTTKRQSTQHHHVRCRFKVGKNARHMRVVDRAFMMIARAFLADVDVIVLNRTEMVFSDEQRRRLYGSLRQCMCVASSWLCCWSVKVVPHSHAA